ncbi:MAG: helix-turn-helix domain-containing protein [Pseudomonadota bacterium]
MLSLKEDVLEASNAKLCGTPFIKFQCQMKEANTRKGMRVEPHDKRQASLLVKATIQIVAMAFELDSQTIMVPQRGVARIARARQVACYLLHTSLSMSLIEIGRAFSKDRTTIGHACRLVEDLRDEPAFDDRISELEKTLHLIKDLANIDL